MSTSQNEPLQSTKRRRYRIPRSCDRCRTAKVKCVFENDRCDACARAGVQCTFANPGSLAERPPTYKDVEQLQARIRSLERLLHAADPTINLNDLPDPTQLSRNHSSSSSAAVQRPPSPEKHVTNQGFPKTQPSIVLPDVNELSVPSKPPLTHAHWCESDKSKPVTNYTGVTIQPDCYIGPNSLFSTIDAEVCRVPNLPPCEPGPAYPVDEFLCARHEEYSASTKYFYPEPDLEEELIKLYFQHVHPLIPVVHPTSFRTLHQSGLAHTSNSFRSLCLIMFSVASHHTSDPRVRIDLTGEQQTSRQFSGLRYAYATYLALFRLSDHYTDLFELQAYVLMTIASFSALTPMVSWIFVEQGLHRAQESGAHREVHPRWNANPLQDFLRRQAFFHLYELDHKISAILDRSPWMEAEDFDLKPPLPQNEDKLGIFVNPYTPISQELYEIYVACDAVRVSLLQVGSLHSMLRVLNLMKGGKNTQEGQGSLRPLKVLVDQIDRYASKWFDQLPHFLKRSNVESAPEHLMISVLVTTSYYDFQQRIHRTLFNYEEGTERLEDRKRRKKPHMNRCIKYAVSAIQEMGKLRIRGLLTNTCFWLPDQISLAVILLICSIRKQRKHISRLEDRMRRDHISLGILILDELAPNAHMASFHSKILNILVDLLDQENPSVLESLASPPSADSHPSPPSGQHPSPPSGQHPSPPSGQPEAPPSHGPTGVPSGTTSCPPAGWEPLDLAAFALDYLLSPDPNSTCDAPPANVPHPDPSYFHLP